MSEPAPTAEHGQSPAGVRHVAAPVGGPFAARLAAAIEAFNRGDFRAVRAAAREVLAGEPTAAERELALELLRRTGIDPAALIVGAITALACAWALLAAWLR